jgi:cysteinyl-tRNA synthetase
MVQTKDEKMAKSVGNIAPLHELIAQWGRHAVVMYLIGGHYRQPLVFSEVELADADRRVYRIRDALRRVRAGEDCPELAHHLDAFMDALAANFNTPMALGAMFGWIREANARSQAAGGRDLERMLALLGLGDLSPLRSEPEADLDARALELLERREAARAAKDFDEADRLREEITALGWELRDRPDGPAELIARSSS